MRKDRNAKVLVAHDAKATQTNPIVRLGDVHDLNAVYALLEDYLSHFVFGSLDADTIGELGDELKKHGYCKFEQWTFSLA